LAELSIVILLLSILATIAAPRFTAAVESARLRAAATVLKAHLEHARSRAIHRGRPVTVTLSGEKDAYFSTDVDSPERPGAELSIFLAEAYGVPIQLAADFGGGETLTFDMHGVPRNASGEPAPGRAVLTVRGLAWQVNVSGVGTVTAGRASIAESSG
jgi:type II secretory pathway pseudopilin PulG